MNQGTNLKSPTGAHADVELQGRFLELADHIKSRLHGSEDFLAEFSAEKSDFVRFNRAKIRQAGRVTQRSISIELVEGSRHSSAGITLSGEPATDRARCDAAIEELRGRLPHLQDDPHLLFSREVHDTEAHGQDETPDAGTAMAQVLDAAAGREFVGIWASGGIYSGFANSFGQRNWFSSHTFNLDWSLYHRADKAVKCGYAGFSWDQAEYQRRLDAALVQLEVLAREPKTIAPGRYRVYLAPDALSEIIGMLSWGGLGLKSHRTKQTMLIKMVEEGWKLHPAVTLRENTKDGVAQNFQSLGFIKPDSVTIIEKGLYKDCLVSPRSAKEYGVPTNGANSYEGPESVEMDAGDIPEAEVAARLGTGILINNLWYLNFSDRPSCRMTGMTRFATFWVEDGKIIAPLNVMRFDETIYRALGEKLVGLTQERLFILDASTYYQRSTGSWRLPGAMIDDFTFTL
jgi:predicted Zn-dependent protease